MVSAETTVVSVHEQLLAFGWTANSSADSLRIQGVGTGGYQIGRAWSPDGAYTSVPVPRSLYVMFTIEGRGVIDHGGSRIEYSPNHLVFLDGEAVSRIDVHQPTARFLWRFDSSALRTPRVRAMLGEQIPVKESVWGPVRALTNGLIDADPVIANSAYAARASEEMLAAAFEHSAPPALRGGRPDQVYGEALAAIEAHSDDPSFTSSRLARLMLVSEGTLRRAFELMGTSPDEELRRQRIRRLRARFDPAADSAREFARQAEASGFASVEQARRALGLRWPQPTRPAKALIAGPGSLQRPSARRAIALRGDGAEQWFAGRGLSVRAQGLHVLTEEISTKDFRIARIWQTAGELSSDSPIGRFLVIAHLEGHASVVLPDSTEEALPVEPGDVVVVPRGSRYRLVSTGPAARIELECAHSALPRAVSEPFAGGELIKNPPSALRDALISVIHDALNSDLDIHDAGFPHFSLAIRHHMASLLMERAVARVPGGSSRTADLYRAARELILTRAQDATFTVAVLARELQISERYLRQVFTAHGSSPSRELRAARVSLAQSFLAADVDGGRRTRTEVARLAGFGHVASLRAALKSQER